MSCRYVDDCKYSVSSTRKYTSKYTINHLLLSLGLASEASDTGKYPSAGTKGDDSEDGECTKADAAAQWLDCGIPCPVGDNARMEADDDWDDAILPRVGLVGSGRVYGADAVVVPPAVPLGEGTRCSYVSV